MGLEDYHKKRNFHTTPEPSGVVAVQNLYRFVVQRHKASHLHYDLRLEIEGVLKSWAIPKGPSMNTDDKRLAVQTEDHPIDYLTFHGSIPKGNYGAGSMTIWDSGTFLSKLDTLKSYEEGKLSISFSGTKLKGLFGLVKTHYQGKKNMWLLIKKKDAYAVTQDYDAETYALKDKESHTTATQSKRTLLKTTIKPMLASPGAEVFNSPGYIYELKYDGYRCIAHIADGDITLNSRNGVNFNEKFSEIVNALKELHHDAVLDGEIVFVNAKGVPQFQELQHYPDTESKGTLQYIIFDLLYLNGHNTIDLPLTDRKSLLKELLPTNNKLLYCDDIIGMGTTLYEQALTLGMEGIIAKKANSSYQLGYRSDTWLKFKNANSAEAFICGYTISDKVGRAFGSLILGMISDEHLAYVGNCGSGFSQKLLTSLKKQFESFVKDETPFDHLPNLKGRKPVWMQPILIAEIEFTEWTKENQLRHPVFKSLRQDKLLPDNILKQEPIEKKGSTKTSPNSSNNNTLKINGINVPVSNLEKVFWPDSGLRKYDLIDYYIQVSDYILPYLIDRPQNLHRHPNGIDQPSFYQKDQEYLPTWIKTKLLESKSTGKFIDYLVCQDEATLVYMANLGCIEINPWHSTMYNLEHPDYTIIDLDPSDKNTFQQVLETALMAKTILEKAKIPSFCKTSGSSGLHIYIPLGGLYDYKQSVNFTKLLCLYIQERLPKLTTMERSLKKRGPKIYLDYLQNRKGQTIVSAYSARPKRNATVSAPVSWKEVEKGFEIADFHIKNMPERLKEKGDLFAPILNTAINMELALKNLEA